MEASCVLSKHTIVLPPSLSHLYVFIRRLLHGLFIVTFRSREWIGRCGLVAATKQLASCGSYESPRQHTDKHNARTHTQKVFCVCSVYCCCNTGHVYEAVVLPRNPPTTLLSFPPSVPPSLFPSRCVSVGSPARSSLSFPASFHYRDGCESVQVGSPVVPEQRNGGRQPPGTCCLFTAAPSAHKTGKSQDVCVRTGEGKRVRRWRTGRAGPGRGKSGCSSYGSKAN